MILYDQGRLPRADHPVFRTAPGAAGQPGKDAVLRDPDAGHFPGDPLH